MARMIPPTAPAARQGLRAERALFEALRDGLPDDYFVYYSLHYLGERANQGEVDFLIVHRERGMLVLECKGGGVKRRADGSWVRVFEGRESPMHSPFAQAQRQMHTLVRELEQRLEKPFPLVYGYAVAFPFVDGRELELPLEARPEIVLTARDLEAIEPWVVGAFELWRKASRSVAPGMTAEEFAHFRRHELHPELRLIETLGARLVADGAALARLGEEQLLVLRGLVDSRRLRVLGGAGSGKTALALEAVRRRARTRREKILLTCVHSALAESLGATVASWGPLASNIDVLTFAELSSNAARYDAIVVDEGEDFDVARATTLEGMLVDPAKSALIVFADPGQKDVGEARDTAAFADAPATYSLTVNYRNTRAIAEVVQALGVIELEPHPRAPEGEAPVVHPQPGPLKTKAQVEQLVRRLIDNNGVAASKIAVLTPRPPESSSLGKVTELGGAPVSHDPEARGDGLLHTTIDALKGLESDVVIVVDIDATCERHTKYLAASRAKQILHVFAKDAETTFAIPEATTD